MKIGIKPCHLGITAKRWKFFLNFYLHRFVFRIHVRPELRGSFNKKVIFVSSPTPGMKFTLWLWPAFLVFAETSTLPETIVGLLQVGGQLDPIQQAYLKEHPELVRLSSD